MIKVLLLEKNRILANHLKETFNQDEQIQLVGSCTEGNEIIEFLKQHPVDVVVIDPQQTNGFVVTVQIKQEFPKVAIIGYSDNDNNGDRLVEYGAVGYLNKYDATLKELMLEIKKYDV